MNFHQIFMPAPLLLCLVGWGLAALLTGSSATAAERPLTFAIIDAPPFGERHTDNAPEGIYPAFLKAVSRESGLAINVVLVPFARAAHLVTSGAVDGTIMFKTDGTEGRTVPLVALFETGLIVQSRPGLTLRKRGDLGPRLIGRLRGGCLDLQADTSFKGRFYELNSQNQGVAMLAAGRIDAFCTVPEAIAVALKSSSASTIIDTDERITISSQKVWILLNPSVSWEVQERLRQAATRIRTEGTLRSLFRRQLGPNYTLRLARE